jgi:hypothetical protein
MAFLSVYFRNPGVAPVVLSDQPNGPLSYLKGILTRSCYGTHPLKE